MPASSIDTFFACSLMVILIASAMVGTAKVVQPHLKDMSSLGGLDYAEGFTEYLLLSTGNPPDWGKIVSVVPQAFGLASTSSHPYALDIDKVSRLNSENVFAISYSDIAKGIGIELVPSSVEIRFLFEASISLISYEALENETIYTFQIITNKSGFPISASLQSYFVTENYVDKVSSSTNSSGIGIMNASLPNAIEAAASLLVFAKASTNPQMMAFSTYCLGHNSDPPEPNKTFLKLSPANHILNVSLSHPQVDILNVYIFTYNYGFNLTRNDIGNQTEEYNIPYLLDVSPMIFVLIGSNGSTSFAEWTSYPQLPLEIGADMWDSPARSKTIALTYIVSINAVLYEAVISCRNAENYDE
ncbi:MAG: hypothetical protein JSV64_08865 [Candidatus Bathyarchaeota archaeon]|nr:MAG: hypothetical protein JSV64_08865 [Candidatus Bathyarchaeota archaeon]